MADLKEEVREMISGAAMDPMEMFEVCLRLDEARARWSREELGLSEEEEDIVLAVTKLGDGRIDLGDVAASVRGALPEWWEEVNELSEYVQVFRGGMGTIVRSLIQSLKVIRTQEAQDKGGEGNDEEGAREELRGVEGVPALEGATRVKEAMGVGICNCRAKGHECRQVDGDGTEQCHNCPLMVLCNKNNCGWMGEEEAGKCGNKVWYSKKMELVGVNSEMGIHGIRMGEECTAGEVIGELDGAYIPGASKKVQEVRAQEEQTGGTLLFELSVKKGFVSGQHASSRGWKINSTCDKKSVNCRWYEGFRMLPNGKIGLVILIVATKDIRRHEVVWTQYALSGGRMCRCGLNGCGAASGENEPG